MTKADLKTDWPAEELETIGSCPVCHCSERKQLYSGLTDNVFFVAPGSWTLWRCEECAAAYLDPRPTEASIGRAYEKYYTHRGDWQPATPSSFLQRVRAALGNGYRNTRFGTQLRPAIPLGNTMARLLPWLRSPIDSHYRWLPQAPHSRAVLDVGCGSGEWLAIARDAGWNVFGIEPDLVSRKMAEARGIEVWGSIDEARAERPVFDYITLSHVIEHVHDPVGLLKSCFDLLRPGGGIYIDTPNLDALGLQLFGRYWRGLETPRHLVLFGRTSLHRALKKSGFTKPTLRIKRVFQGISRQSALMARGVDPYAVDAPPVKISTLDRLRAVLTIRHTEFLTLTAEKSA